MILPAYRPDHTLAELTEQLWEYGIQPLVVDDGSEPEYRHFFEEISDISVVLRHREQSDQGSLPMDQRIL